MSSDFTTHLEKHLDQLSEALFSELNSSEELNLNLAAEESTYIRFNRSQVRQNTYVDQKVLSMQLQSQQRKASFDFTLTGKLEEDLSMARDLLQRARHEIQVLPEDPYLVAMQNRGTSRKHHPGSLLSPQAAMDQIVEASKGADFVGFYASGPTVRASKNSKGQSHWFSTESFFVDYSLFTTNVDGENKAVKGVYADSRWSEADFARKLEESRRQLSLMERKSTKLNPNAYRAFLAPGAMAEICQMLSWNALSFSALKKGSCAFAKLYDKQKSLSPLFNLKENFALGLCPQFNSLGEMAPEELVLIEKGELKNMLVSSRAEKEYGVKSNGSDSGGWGFESLRSPEIGAGSLKEIDVLKALGTGVYLSHLHYLNWSDVSSARLTGMTRYACFWVEKGEIVGPIKDMRFDDSLYSILGNGLEALTQEQHIDPAVSTYFLRDIGGKKLPGALMGQFTFTL